MLVKAKSLLTWWSLKQLVLQLLFLRCHPYEECKHQNLKKYKIPFFVHFMWRDSGCRGDIPRNCFFFTPILASIRALYFWLAIFSLIGDWKGLLTVNKDIPCCFKPGTLSNKCYPISVMKTPALLPVCSPTNLGCKAVVLQNLLHYPPKLEIWKL